LTVARARTSSRPPFHPPSTAEMGFFGGKKKQPPAPVSFPSATPMGAAPVPPPPAKPASPRESRAPFGQRPPNEAPSPAENSSPKEISPATSPVRSPRRSRRVEREHENVSPRGRPVTEANGEFDSGLERTSSLSRARSRKPSAADTSYEDRAELRRKMDEGAHAAHLRRRFPSVHRPRRRLAC